MSQIVRLFNKLLRPVTIPSSHHFWGSLAIVLVILFFISGQISNRSSFANSELKQDVMARWGAPIRLAAPSVRYVQTGSVFTHLELLPLTRQEVVANASMNYRKRGLVYFSGFDLALEADYAVRNPEPHAIDIVFVFPIELEKNRVLLSDLSFLVGEEPQEVRLTESAEALVWTGRLEPQEEATFHIAFMGRGLESFLYQMDPGLPARDFRLAMNVTGGRGYDYAQGVMPAHRVAERDSGVGLEWRFNSLESGVPVGLILPAEQSFDSIIVTMLRRSWATFLCFFVALVVLGLARQRPFRVYEAYLASAGYGFFFVLLAYLAAFIHFYWAYLLSLLVVGGMLGGYLGHLLGWSRLPHVLGILVSFLAVPTLAVILQGYTGLIYTLEILTLLVALMVLTTRPAFRRLLDRPLVPREQEA